LNRPENKNTRVMTVRVSGKSVRHTAQGPGFVAATWNLKAAESKA